MKNRKFKLFVWTGFAPDWTSGLAFAIARDEAEARTSIITAKGYSPSDWGHLQILPLNMVTAFAVAGGG